MKCTVLGAGAWGTTFGQVMADAGNDVTMWAIEPEIVEGIRDRHHNAVRLPSVAKLPDNMTATGDRAQAVKALRRELPQVEREHVAKDDLHIRIGGERLGQHGAQPLVQLD